MIRHSFPEGSLSGVCLIALGLAGLADARASDTYSAGQLTIPALQIGTATYSNVVVQLGPIVTAPNGISAYGTIDAYSPIDTLLTTQTVMVGSNTYYNAAATVKALSTIGGVSGADTYDPVSHQITLAAAQAGNAIYTGVVITLGSIVSTGSGMPRNILDVYDIHSGQLTMSAIQVGTKVYTNGIITPGRIVSIAGQLPLESSFYQFSNFTAGGIADGAGPHAGLLLGKDGNFYGTTRYGGTAGQGTVVRLTPAGTESVFYEFGARTHDGADPVAGLIQDGAGNLYGTTTSGGSHGQGTIYAIDPSGTESVIYSFGASPTDGTAPYGSLIQDSNGNFYGTTSSGGTHGSGTVFMVSPTGAETVQYSFQGSADGSAPFAGLSAGNDGNFYGTTTSGGANFYGTVFRITPGVPGGAFATVYGFGANGATDAALPYAGLTLAKDGNFYGTSYLGGQYGAGTVFRILPTGAESVVYSFSGGGAVEGSMDGASPYAGVMQASDGNLYGTTSTGGAYNAGAVFRVNPGSTNATGQELLLYSFTGDPGGGGGISGSLDGSQPTGNLVEDASHNFYGTAFTGGVNLGGTIYKLTSVLTSH